MSHVTYKNQDKRLLDNLPQKYRKEWPAILGNGSEIKCVVSGIRRNYSNFCVYEKDIFLIGAQLSFVSIDFFDNSFKQIELIEVIKQKSAETLGMLLCIVLFFKPPCSFILEHSKITAYQCNVFSSKVSICSLK